MLELAPEFFMAGDKDLAVTLTRELLRRTPNHPPGLRLLAELEPPSAGKTPPPKKKQGQVEGRSRRPRAAAPGAPGGLCGAGAGRQVPPRVRYMMRSGGKLFRASSMVVSPILTLSM